MNILVRKLKRFLEGKKYRLIDLKSGHVYFLWMEGGNDMDLEPLHSILRDLDSMDIQVIAVSSRECKIIECKD